MWKKSYPNVQWDDCSLEMFLGHVRRMGSTSHTKEERIIVNNLYNKAFKSGFGPAYIYDTKIDLYEGMPYTKAIPSKRGIDERNIL